MSHETIVAMAKQAIRDVFTDTSVDVWQTKESLSALREEIDSFLEAMEGERG